MTPDELEDLKRRAFGWNGKEFHQEPFDELCAYFQAQRDDKYLGKAIELWTAGWQSETPHQSQAIVGLMSWYWRRPPRGNRKTGRLFLSTDQAYNAMKREAKT